MRTGILSIVLVAVVLAAAAAWWFLGTPRVSAPVLPVPAASVATHEAREASALARPPEVAREEVAPAQPVVAASTDSAPPIETATKPRALLDLSDPAKLTEEELRTEHDMLEAELVEKTTPILQAIIDSGRGETLAGPGEGLNYPFRKGDTTAIMTVVYHPDRGSFRAELSRADYPDFYEIKDRILTLDQLANEKESERLAARKRAIEAASKK